MFVCIAHMHCCTIIYAHIITHTGSEYFQISIIVLLTRCPKHQVSLTIHSSKSSVASRVTKSRMLRKKALWPSDPLRNPCCPWDCSNDIYCGSKSEKLFGRVGTCRARYMMVHADLNFSVFKQNTASLWWFIDKVLQRNQLLRGSLGTNKAWSASKVSKLRNTQDSNLLLLDLLQFMSCLSTVSSPMTNNDWTTGQTRLPGKSGSETENLQMQQNGISEYCIIIAIYCHTYFEVVTKYAGASVGLWLDAWSKSLLSQVHHSLATTSQLPHDDIAAILKRLVRDQNIAVLHANK